MAALSQACRLYIRPRIFPIETCPTLLRGFVRGLSLRAYADLVGKWWRRWRCAHAVLELLYVAPDALVK